MSGKKYGGMQLLLLGNELQATFIRRNTAKNHGEESRCSHPMSGFKLLLMLIKLHSQTAYATVSNYIPVICAYICDLQSTNNSMANIWI